MDIEYYKPTTEEERRHLVQVCKNMIACTQGLSIAQTMYCLEIVREACSNQLEKMNMTAIMEWEEEQ